MANISKTHFPNDSVTCVSPWDVIRIVPDGAAKYCDSCKGSVSDVGDDYLRWWQESAFIKNLRADIRQGIEIPSCSRCYDAERTGGVSFRTRRHFQSAIHHNKYFRISLEQSPQWKRLQKDDVAGLPAYVSVSFTNECNNRCIMCTPDFSNLVSEDYVDFDLADKVVNVNWTNGQDFESRYQSILKMIVDNPRLFYVELNGGEPFINPTSQKFLTDIIDHGKKDFHFMVNTNGTVWNQQMIDCMIQFQTTTVDFSIETMDHVNDYVRFGSSLEDIKSVIQRYKQYESDKFQLILHCVPQALSVFNLDSLIDYCAQEQCFLMGNPLWSPNYFALQVLPLELRRSLAESWMEKYHISQVEIGQDIDHASQTNFVRFDSTPRGSLPFYLKDFVIKMIKHLLRPEPSDAELLRRKLIRHVTLFDKKHGTNFLSTFPHLEQLFYQYR